MSIIYIKPNFLTLIVLICDDQAIESSEIWSLVVVLYIHKQIMLGVRNGRVIKYRCKYYVLLFWLLN